MVWIKEAEDEGDTCILGLHNCMDYSGWINTVEGVILEGMGHVKFEVPVDIQ